jgi:hypothetical protein
LAPNTTLVNPPAVAAGLEFRLALTRAAKDRQQTLTVTGLLKSDIGALIGTHEIEPEAQPAATARFLDLLRVHAGIVRLHLQHIFKPNESPLGGQYVCDGSVMIGGFPVEKTESYRVTMNSFLAIGGDNFTVFNDGTEQLGGDVDLDALEAYFVANSPVAPGSQDRIQ